MPWIVVIGERVALDWVLAEKRMAFAPHVNTARVSAGDRFLLYVTRSAFHNPTRDEAQVIAVGSIAGPVVPYQGEIGGFFCTSMCELRFDAQLPARSGLSFRPLVRRLDFIVKKESWAAYMRRTLVPISDRDYQLVAAEFFRFSELPRR